MEEDPGKTYPAPDPDDFRDEYGNKKDKKDV